MTDYGHPDVNPLTGAKPLDDREASRLLGEVLERARRASESALVVFDLDSTLLDNRPRQSLIMREYGQEHSVPELVGNCADHWKGWDARIAMANSGLDDAGIERHFDPFRKYWWERFFTSEYCKHDVPISGAVEYAGAVAETPARLLYVTGRHEAMRPGTLASFEVAGFPMPDDREVLLLMKPTLEEHDDTYKERTYARLRELGEMIAAFDNEPTHINGYHSNFPGACCVHLATDHSLREVRVDSAIPSIRHFGSFRA